MKMELKHCDESNSALVSGPASELRRTQKPEMHELREHGWER